MGAGLRELGELRELLWSLLGVRCVSGFEEPMIEWLLGRLGSLCDEVWQTPRGNVVGVQRGVDEEAPRVALAAHMDQVGFVVFSVDDRGFLRFRRVGGSVLGAVQGQVVWVHGLKGVVPGVVGVRPGHMTRGEEAFRVPPVERLYIDVGAGSREEAEEMGVVAGCPVSWGGGPVELGGSLVAAPGADDRAGLASILTVAKALSGRRVDATVYYVGTVEEEIGLRGAAVALHGLDVDMAVAVDTCPSGYQPDVDPLEVVYEVGKGPALQVGEMGSRMAFGHRVLVEWLWETARSHGLPIQRGVMHGGTDASAMSQTGGGVPSVAFSIPRRYSHSPVEVFSLLDLYHHAQILELAVQGLSRDFKLLRV